MVPFVVHAGAGDMRRQGEWGSSMILPEANLLSWGKGGPSCDVRGKQPGIHLQIDNT
jgi:hypothetical protein